MSVQINLNSLTIGKAENLDSDPKPSFSFGLVNLFSALSSDTASYESDSSLFDFNKDLNTAFSRAIPALSKSYSSELWLSKYPNTHGIFQDKGKKAKISSSDTSSSPQKKDTTQNRKAPKRTYKKKTQPVKLLGKKVRHSESKEQEAFSSVDQRRLNSVKNGYCSALGYFLDNPETKKHVLARLKQFYTQFPKQIEEFQKNPKAAFMLTHFPDTFEVVENFFCQFVLMGEKRASAAFPETVVKDQDVMAKPESDCLPKRKWSPSLCDPAKCYLISSSKANARIKGNLASRRSEIQRRRHVRIPERAPIQARLGLF